MKQSAIGNRLGFGRALRWCLAGLAIVGTLAVVAPSARADECEDYTPDGRKCTFTEDLGFCLTNAMTSYTQCKDGANWAMRAICLAAYELDFYACYASVPFEHVRPTL